MAAFDENLFFATIGELNARLLRREFSAVELARAFLDRLEALGPRYNALALSMRETALEQARRADDEIRRGRRRGPLQGIPYGAKDLLSVAGKPTAWGARPYARQTLPYTATVLRKLERVGAVLIGKLAMIELAGGGGYRWASASMHGPCLNPWDTSRWAGGSSSGSGAAVAAGLVPFALGSETWGSIVTPAAYCGVTGLRPTYGLVSRYGAMALSWTMDKIGPLARSAEDCGLILQVISGGDSQDPGSAGKSFYYAPQYARPLKELRAGFAPADFEEWAEPAARPDFLKALDTLRGLGLQFRQVRLPEFPYSAVAGLIIDAEGSAAFEDLITSGRVNELDDARQIAGLRAGLEIAAKDYLRAMRIRRLIQQELRKLLADVDLLVSPARFGPASRISEPLDRPRSQASRPKDRGLSDLGAAGNLAGLPALVLPCGFAGGLPVAIQLVGRPFSENTLLAVGREFQRVTDWHRRRPPAIPPA
ncbi:MAG: amidase [Bryobacterales bacterium]|nr:amidase [Bryobacteraceae bacterium]MDW8131993.1 amidase [Bryobacterales bacterium]